MRSFLIAAIVLMALIVSGCASLDTTERHGFEVRGDYVAAVERTAKSRGVEVIWLNPPTQRRSRQIEWTTETTVEFNRNPDS